MGKLISRLVSEDCICLVLVLVMASVVFFVLAIMSCTSGGGETYRYCNATSRPVSVDGVGILSGECQEIER